MWRNSRIGHRRLGSGWTKHTVLMMLMLFASVSPGRAAELPQDHEYQKVLRGWLAGLTEADLTVEIQPFREEALPTEPAAMHRLSTLLLGMPPYDVGLPASQFLLANIETKDGVQLPSMSPEGTAFLAKWDHPINPYHGNAALKRRALVWTSVDMMMLDAHHDQKQGRRSDFLGGTLIWLAYTYQACGDVMPAPVRAAYEQGLRRMVMKVKGWGPQGSMTDMDLFAPVGLWYAAQAIGDPELVKLAEDYSRPLFTSPRFFHPAGYFVDVGAYDVTYNGISLYFAAHAAAVTHWDFAINALTKAYELRRYMAFPDPAFGGQSYGPSSFSPRTSHDAAHDQWNRAVRHGTAAMYSDQAIYLMPRPTQEFLQAAMAKLYERLQARNRPAKRDPVPWQESHWSSDISYVYEGYVDGFYERCLNVRDEKPELMIAPFKREGEFTRNFADTLLIAKREKFGVILHTGPIGRQTGRLYGFSGGSLAGFWTPAAGPAILGRRSGSQGQAKPDNWNNWQFWPVHATTGLTHDDVVFSVARVRLPKATYDLGDKVTRVTATGVIKTGDGASGELAVPIAYQRDFELTDAGLSVRTTLQPGEGELSVKALYEILPVFYGVPRGRRGPSVSAMLGRSEGQWHELTTEPRVVDAVRIERADGAVLITLDRARPVRLSPDMWQEYYQSRVTCRNIMVDLLDGKPETVLGDLSVQYMIEPAAASEPAAQEK